jgi:hypothetical protein
VLLSLPNANGRQLRSKCQTCLFMKQGAAYTARVTSTKGPDSIGLIHMIWTISQCEGGPVSENCNWSVELEETPRSAPLHFCNLTSVPRLEEALH